MHYCKYFILLLTIIIFFSKYIDIVIIIAQIGDVRSVATVSKISQKNGLYNFFKKVCILYELVYLADILIVYTMLSLVCLSAHISRLCYFPGILKQCGINTLMKRRRKIYLNCKTTRDRFCIVLKKKKS